jgi:hypothetical protein
MDYFSAVGGNIRRREMLARTAAGLSVLPAAVGLDAPVCGEEKAEFKYRVSTGWLRDLASEPAPVDAWPCIRWDDCLLADQISFLDAGSKLGMNYNCAWGLFRSRDWPVPFENVISPERAAKLKSFVDTAHERGVKVLAGLGVYSWGFEEVIRKAPGVSAGNSQAMCLYSSEAWDWMRRVLDFHLDPVWGLDGVSMQSADQGRCECVRCSRLSPAEYHAKILIRTAEYIRTSRPEWTIGQSSWGMRVDEPSEFEHFKRIAAAVDYMVEVQELSSRSGRRREIVKELGCAFGSLGGVLVEPPQHWDRLRWFLPCGLGSAGALRNLKNDGGAACEYFYRPFANPSEEVSWRTGALVLCSVEPDPEKALSRAVEAVYNASGVCLSTMCDLYSRGEKAYFSRVEFKPGDGSISLEPLVWKENPSAPGPPVYLGRMDKAAREDYASDLKFIRNEFSRLNPGRSDRLHETLRCIDGALADIAALNR